MPRYTIKRFYPSLRKVQRAREHMRELKSLIADWNSRFSTEIERDRETGDSFLVLRTERPPTEIGLALGDAIHCLSCAMDYAVSNVVAEKTGKHNRRVYFPTHETLAGLAQSFEIAAPTRCGCGKGEITKKGSNAAIRAASPELEKLILELNPTQEFNSVFWAVRKLDNYDKHNVLPVVLGKCRVEGLEIFSPAEHSVGNVFEFGAGMPVRLGNVVEGETFIGRQSDFRTQLVFGEGTAVAQLPVAGFLVQAADIVEQMVIEFERRFAVLEAVPGT